MTISLQKDSIMQKKCVPYGSDVSAGEFQCADCGRKIKMGSKTSPDFVAGSPKAF